MSGVLDRMVQRVRGGLPAIAPLVRSDRTAAQLGAQLGGAAVPVESHEERVEPVRGDARAIRSAGAEVRREDGEPAAREARSATEERQERRERKHIPSTPDGNERVPARTSRDGGEARAKRNEIAKGEAAATEESGGERKRSASAEEPQEDFEGARDRAAQVETEESRIEIPTKAQIRNDGAGTRPGEAHKAPEAATGDAERVEIQISIGTVELRAPRPAAPPVMPASPSFRPRVTLDDYLKRGPGSSRYGGRS
jgi:hypothetical protein